MLDLDRNQIFVTIRGNTCFDLSEWIRQVEAEMENGQYLRIPKWAASHYGGTWKTRTHREKLLYWLFAPTEDFIAGVYMKTLW